MSNANINEQLQRLAWDKCPKCQGRGLDGGHYCDCVKESLENQGYKYGERKL